MSGVAHTLVQVKHGPSQNSNPHYIPVMDGTVHFAHTQTDMDKNVVHFHDPAKAGRGIEMSDVHLYHIYNRSGKPRTPKSTDNTYPTPAQQSFTLQWAPFSSVTDPFAPWDDFNDSRGVWECFPCVAVSMLGL